MKDVCLKPDSGDAAAKGRLDFLSAVVYVCLISDALSRPVPGRPWRQTRSSPTGLVLSLVSKTDSLTLALMADIPVVACLVPHLRSEPHQA